jgi:hypothetical protein
MRGPAVALLATSDVVRQAYSALAEVEKLLGRTQPMSLGNIDHLVKFATRHRQKSLVAHLAARAGWAAAAVLALCFGLGFGAIGLDHDETQSNFIEIAFLPFEPIDVD